MVIGIISDIPSLYDTALKNAYHMMWNELMLFLGTHWLAVIGYLTALLIFAVAIYLFTGRWGMLGSVLYHYLYLGILFLLGLIKGPKVFVSEYFEVLCAAILYPLCYLVVRKILTVTGIRSKF